MPTYVYRCERCGAMFEQQLSVAAHEDAHPLCPKCGHAKVTGVVSIFYAKTSKKS